MDSSFVKKIFLLISNRMKIGPTLDQKRKIALHHFNVGLMFILLEMCRITLETEMSAVYIFMYKYLYMHIV